MSTRWTRAILICLCSVAVLAAGCVSSRTQAQSGTTGRPALGPYPQSVIVALRNCDISVRRVRVIDDPNSTIPLLVRHSVFATVSPEAVSPGSGKHFVDVIVEARFSDGRSFDEMPPGWNQRIIVGGQTLEPVDAGITIQGSTLSSHARFSIPQATHAMVLRVTPSSDVSSIPVDFDLW